MLDRVSEINRMQDAGSADEHTKRLSRLYSQVCYRQYIIPHNHVVGM